MNLAEKLQIFYEEEIAKLQIQNKSEIEKLMKDQSEEIAFLQNQNKEEIAFMQSIISKQNKQIQIYQTQIASLRNTIEKLETQASTLKNLEILLKKMDITQNEYKNFLEDAPTLILNLQEENLSLKEENKILKTFYNQPIKDLKQYKNLTQTITSLVPLMKNLQNLIEELAPSLILIDKDISEGDLANTIQKITSNMKSFQEEMKTISDQL